MQDVSDSSLRWSRVSRELVVDPTRQALPLQTLLLLPMEADYILLGLLLLLLPLLAVFLLFLRPHLFWPPLPLHGRDRARPL